MSTKAPEQIRIKTLEEIKQAKIARALSQKDAEAGVTNTDLPKATKGIKRSNTITGAPIGHVKTFSEIIQEKKRKQEEQQNQNPNLMKVEESLESCSGKSQSVGEAPDVEKVRVKTLEEIRKEKAARAQAQQNHQTETSQSSDTESRAPQKLHLLRINKLSSQQCKKHF